MLDASVVIAVLERTDSHNGVATQMMLDNASAGFAIHPVTRAEALVGAARQNRLGDAERAIRSLGVVQFEPDVDEPSLVAELRLATKLKLPDCYVLSLALQISAPVATFDVRLARVAREQGIRTIEVGAPPTPRLSP